MFSNLYIPKIEGKEKRKASYSKDGLLGIEGAPNDILLNLLSPFSSDSPKKDVGNITKTDLFVYGLSGGSDSKSKREIILEKLNLPKDMSANAMLSAINILYSKEEFEESIKNSL